VAWRYLARIAKINMGSSFRWNDDDEGQGLRAWVRPSPG